MNKKDTDTDIIKRHVSGIYKTWVKWFLVWVTFTDMLGGKLMVFKVYMVNNILAKNC